MDHLCNGIGKILTGPNFIYNNLALLKLEEQFSLNSAIIIAIQNYLDLSEQDFLRVAMVGEEAIKTSEIEGENLKLLLAVLALTKKALFNIMQ